MRGVLSFRLFFIRPPFGWRCYLFKCLAYDPRLRVWLADGGGVEVGVFHILSDFTAIMSVSRFAIRIASFSSYAFTVVK